jgi:hypothetical protein
LWKLSSIGGTILYTLPRISFLDAEAIFNEKNGQTDRNQRGEETIQKMKWES